ncbi:MAG: hypothetical protein MUE84_08620, partial [Hyphomonas sp.]|nr:hypothetical protein [Hyphomonas sp.]
MPKTFKGGQLLRPPRRKPVSRDQRIDFSQPVRILKVEPSTLEKPARKGWPFIVAEQIVRLSLPNLPPVWGEAPNEPLAVMFEWALRRPSTIIAQPEVVTFEIDGHVLRHIPDFLVIANGRKTRLEVKAEGGLGRTDVQDAKLAAFAAAYEAEGLAYAVATGQILRAEPLASNVALVVASRHRHVEPSEEARILRALDETTDDRSIPVWAVGGEIRDFAALHARGLLTLDLQSGPLDGLTQVWPGALSFAPPWFTLPPLAA